MKNSIYDELRAQVRELKWKYNYSYKSIAQKIGIKPRSLYCWLNGQFELSFDTEQRLKNVINRFMR